MTPTAHDSQRRSRADELARTIAARYDGEPSLLTSALAYTLAERMLEAIASADAGALVAWLERTCASLPLGEPTAAMLRGAEFAVAPLLRNEARAHELLATASVGIADVLDRHARVLAPPAAYEEELDGAIAAFLVRLDDTDPLSAEHSRAVSLWCRRLATRLGLDEETTRYVARCGMLHDVGKSNTPAAILQAPRQLTDEEWTIMRDHTACGARMLAEIERLRPFEGAARSHHERLDGKGYPDRLSASEIPQAVRIVTVADCFNAMIGRRPYRLPMSPANALEQLVRHRGTQFDPTIVEVMIDIVENPATSR